MQDCLNDRSKFTIVLLLAFIVMVTTACATIGNGGASSDGDRDNDESLDINDEVEETQDEVAMVEPTEAPTVAPTATPTEAPAVYIAVDNAEDVKLLRDLAPAAAQRTAITAVAYDPNKEQVATLGWSSDVNIWDVESGAIIRQLRGHSSYGLGLEYSPDGSRLASGGSDYRVFFWNPDSVSELYQIQANAWVRRVRFSEDGTMLAVAGNLKSSLQLFDTGNGRLIGELQSHNVGLSSAAFSPNNAYAVTGDELGYTIIYSVDDLSILTAIPGPDEGNSVADLEFSADGSTLVAVHEGGQVRAWETNTWSTVSSFSVAFRPDGIFDAAFTRDGDALLVVGDGPIFIIDIFSNGKILYSLDFERIGWSVSLSGDGSRFAVGMDDGSVKILGLE